MDAATKQHIEAIHHLGHYHYVLALTGGGAGVPAQLLKVPGGSRTVLLAIVPYHEQALVEFLGQRPEQFCSAAVSQFMAIRALDRARWLAPGRPVAGIGCTASLATDRPKRGDHRAHFTIATASNSHTTSLILIKGMRDRAGEEGILDTLLLNAMARCFGIDRRLPVHLLPGDLLEEANQPVQPLTGTEPPVCVAVDGQIRREAPLPAALLPGAFNPLHHGHRELARAAAAFLNAPVHFDLSVRNVDKDTLPLEEVERRLRQFAWVGPVWLTTAPTFADKAHLFPGLRFVLGADTAVRLISPRYYQDNPTVMAAAFDLIRQQGCRFLVACRVDHRGQCLQLDDINIPEQWRDLFQAIPPELFRLDVSSTQLRQQTRPTPS